MSVKVRYDKRDVYEKKIAPLITELMINCKLESLPMYITVAVANGGDTTEYVSEMVLASTGIRLADNRFSSILLALNGFEQELPREVQQALGTLQDYIDRTSVRNKSAVPLNLKQNRLIDIHRIVQGKDEVNAPISMIGKEITQDDIEQIDELAHMIPALEEE